MMRKKRISTRFNERTIMVLNELSERMHVKVSVIIRGLVIKGIDEITDASGNLKIDEKQIQEE